MNTVQPTASPDVERPEASSRSLRLGQHRPVVTWAIITLNVLVWLAMTAAGGSTNPQVLLRFGAKVNSRIVGGQVWRLVTPIFVHIGIVHLAFNTYAIHVFGMQIERTFGSLRYLAIYLLSGIAGVLGSFAFSPHPSAGASGAIFGLIGTEAAFFYRYRRAFGRGGQQRLYNILVVIGYNLAFTFVASNIDVWGHLGGLLAGITLGWWLMPQYAVSVTEAGPRVLDLNRPRRWGTAVLGAIVLLVLGALAAIAVRARSI
jgi:rhomboid protease GluP